MAKGRLVVRPHPWRQLPMGLMMAATTVLGVWAWSANTAAGEALGLGAALGLVWAIGLIEAMWVRLIVTSDDVRFTSVHGGPPVPRIRVGHIRALRCNTVFYDHAGKRILETRADLSRAQLLTVANELGVSVWDHRAWHGLRKLEHGVCLNPEPFARRPPG